MEEKKTRYRLDATQGSYQEIDRGNDLLARLENLRGLSKLQNRFLDEKFAEAGLPYGVYDSRTVEGRRVSYPNAIRVAVLYRPEYYKSDEPDKASTRYRGEDDLVTIFMHLRPDGTIQTVRYHLGPTQYHNLDLFVYELMRSLDRKRNVMEASVACGDLDDVANLVVDSLSPLYDPDHYIGPAPHLLKAYDIYSLDGARRYFCDGTRFLYESPEILRNIAKIALTSLLENTLQSVLSARASLGELRELLLEEGMLLGHIRPRVYESTQDLASFVPEYDAYVAQTIQRLIKAYKPEISGWKK